MSAADLIEEALPDALALAGAVRRRDLPEVHRVLYERTTTEQPQVRLYALAVVLAAAIPEDTPIPDLLAWVTKWPAPSDLDTEEIDR